MAPGVRNLQVLWPAVGCTVKSEVAGKSVAAVNGEMGKVPRRYSEDKTYVAAASCRRLRISFAIA